MSIKTIIAAVAMVAFTAPALAQSNETLSTQYKNKIEVLKNQIKTLKSQIKAEPGNSSYVTEKSTKEIELKEVQANKKIIDKLIKAEKNYNDAQKDLEKAKDNCEKAKRQLEDAQKDADKVKASM